MAEKKPIIPLKDLVELYRRNRFPINHIYLKFKDYKWLEKFFEDCFNYLCAHKKIIYHGEKGGWALTETRWFRGYGALVRFVKKELGYNISIYDVLGRYKGVSLLLINFLVEKCNKNLDEVEKQVEKIQLHHPETAKSIGMEIICILYKSDYALAPHNIVRKLESEFGDKKSTAYIATCLRSFLNSGFLSIHGQKGAPLYTLRGEEEKYKRTKI